MIIINIIIIIIIIIIIGEYICLMAAAIAAYPQVATKCAGSGSRAKK